MHVDASQSNSVGELAVLESLTQAHDWLEKLVQSIVEGVVIFDDAGSVTQVDGRMVHCNADPGFRMEDAESIESY